MERPFDGHEREVPLSVAQAWREASPLRTLLRDIEERPGTWDLDLL